MSDDETRLNPVHDHGAVPKGWTCPEHSRLTQVLGEIHATLQQHEKRGDRIETRADELMRLLRNGGVKAQPHLGFREWLVIVLLVAACATGGNVLGLLKLLAEK